MIHEFAEVEWYTIEGRGQVASVIWRGERIDKEKTNLVEFFQEVKIAGRLYHVKAVESYVIQFVRTGDPIGLLVATQLEQAFAPDAGADHG